MGGYIITTASTYWSLTWSQARPEPFRTLSHVAATASLGLCFSCYSRFQMGTMFRNLPSCLAGGGGAGGRGRAHWFRAWVPHLCAHRHSPEAASQVTPCPSLQAAVWPGPGQAFQCRPSWAAAAGVQGLPAQKGLSWSLVQAFHPAVSPPASPSLQVRPSASPRRLGSGHPGRLPGGCLPRQCSWGKVSV